jgi:hypothetical protein
MTNEEAILWGVLKLFINFKVSMFMIFNINFKFMKD